MCTHNILFYGELDKINLEISPCLMFFLSISFSDDKANKRRRAIPNVCVLRGAGQ